MPPVFTVFFEQCGPLAWPLALCSITTLALLIERVVLFIIHQRGFQLFERGIVPTGAQVWLQLQQVQQEQAKVIKPIRDEHLTLWLGSLRRQLLANNGYLHLMGVIAPLLGLLGTVMGITDAFSVISGTSDPVTPALVADGIQSAMLTTIVGLCIAIPALLTAQGFRLWLDNSLELLSERLNIWSLSLELA
ncbi:MotA/TolQ/ExbB proton channel family protein [Shewanella sp. NKUCC01_JLK]|uniref:MotA/TolQ/ExbB proton channel family protein n=1 Tax=Shewanella sp. NKUCC01_JLK TaxID=2842123 RepID=UPI001C5BE8ED|nr:MotA/TolQ/ExbB proton channel family protein [Shewanella sp. NKUCC01_JLK]MBW3517178.1 MotA/TolQ/ExbB proton channel family protein [Shewanella sp. NKUCC01_JLK]